MLGRNALQACKPPARRAQVIASIFGAIRTNVTEATPPPKVKIPVLDLFGDLQIPLPPSRTYMKDDVGPAGARLGQDQFAGRGAMSRNLLQKKAKEVARTTPPRPRVRPTPTARPNESAPPRQPREARTSGSSDRQRVTNIEPLDSDIEEDLLPGAEGLMEMLEVMEPADDEPEPLPEHIDYVQTNFFSLFTGETDAARSEDGAVDVLEDEAVDVLEDEEDIDLIEDEEDIDLIEFDEDGETADAEIVVEEPLQQQIRPAISRSALNGTYSDFLPPRISRVYGETMKKVGPIGYAALVLAKESSVNLKRKKRAMGIVSRLTRPRTSLGERAVPAKPTLAKAAAVKAALGKPTQQRVAARR